MKTLIKKMPGLEFPKQGTVDSAAYDLIATSDPIIIGDSFNLPMEGLHLYRNIQYIQYHTNIFLAPKEGYFTLIFPRSSITKYNLMLKNGVAIIDNDYRGELMIRMSYVIQPEDCFLVPEGPYTKVFVKINKQKIYNKGDSIAQLVGVKKESINFEWTDKLPETQRGIGSFGSTTVK